MGEARASHLPLTGLRVHNLHHSTTPPRILPHQLTREASPIGPLQDQHHEACRGSSDSKSLLLTPRPQDPASAPGGVTQIDPGSAFAERSLYRSYLLWNFFCAFVPQVLRGSRKCWHLGAFHSSATTRLQRYQVSLGPPFVIKFLQRPLGIFSKGGEGSPPPSGGLVPCIVVVTQTRALRLPSCRRGFDVLEIFGSPTPWLLLAQVRRLKPHKL